jgi:hypothetical protein
MDNVPDKGDAELKYLLSLTTEQRRFYLYEVRWMRGKDIEKALREALFSLEKLIKNS